ncbi:MAG: hypothetical protein IKI57_01475 [Clostridia bacterium]|nr:hypothetical protein [Clostridia bacterium]
MSLNGKRKKAAELIGRLTNKVSYRELVEIMESLPNDKLEICKRIEKEIFDSKMPISKSEIEVFEKLDSNLFNRIQARSAAMIFTALSSVADDTMRNKLMQDIQIGDTFFTDSSQVEGYMKNHMKELFQDKFRDLGIGFRSVEDSSYEGIMNAFRENKSLDASILTKLDDFPIVGAMLKADLLKEHEVFVQQTKDRFQKFADKTGRPAMDPANIDTLIGKTGKIYLDPSLAQEEFLDTMAQNGIGIFEYTYETPDGDEELGYSFELDTKDAKKVEWEHPDVDGNRVKETVDKESTITSGNKVGFESVDTDNNKTRHIADNAEPDPALKVYDMPTITFDIADIKDLNTRLEDLKNEIAAFRSKTIKEVANYKITLRGKTLFESVIGDTEPVITDLQNKVKEEVEAVKFIEDEKVRKSPIDVFGAGFNHPDPFDATTIPEDKTKRTITGVKPGGYKGKEFKIKNVEEYDNYIENLIDFIGSNKIDWFEHDSDGKIQEMIDRWHGLTQAEKVKEVANNKGMLSSCDVIKLRDSLQQIIVKEFGKDPATGNYKNKTKYNKFLALHTEHIKNLGSLSKGVPDRDVGDPEPAATPKRGMADLLSRFEEVKKRDRELLKNYAGMIIEAPKAGEKADIRMKKIEDRADALYKGFTGPDPVDEKKMGQRVRIALEYKRWTEALEAIKKRIEDKSRDINLALSTGALSGSANIVDLLLEDKKEFVTNYAKFVKFCKTKELDGMENQEVAARTLGTLQAISVADTITGKKHPLLDISSGDPAIDEKASKQYDIFVKANKTYEESGKRIDRMKRSVELRRSDDGWLSLNPEYQLARKFENHILNNTLLGKSVPDLKYGNPKGGAPRLDKKELDDIQRLVFNGHGIPKDNILALRPADRAEDHSHDEDPDIS